jgi:HsdM N-terminal domain
MLDVKQNGIKFRNCYAVRSIKNRRFFPMKLTLQQLEAHLWGAANILRGKTAGQDYKNYILSLMFYKRLCDQWECEADDAIADLERQHPSLTESQSMRAVSMMSTARASSPLDSSMAATGRKPSADGLPKEDTLPLPG